jgi:hypothetical protein
VHEVTGDDAPLTRGQVAHAVETVLPPMGHVGDNQPHTSIRVTTQEAQTTDVVELVRSPLAHRKSGDLNTFTGIGNLLTGRKTDVLFPCHDLAPIRGIATVHALNQAVRVDGEPAITLIEGTVAGFAVDTVLPHGVSSLTLQDPDVLPISEVNVACLVVHDAVSPFPRVIGVGVDVNDHARVALHGGIVMAHGDQEGDMVPQIRLGVGAAGVVAHNLGRDRGHSLTHLLAPLDHARQACGLVPDHSRVHGDNAYCEGLVGPKEAVLSEIGEAELLLNGVHGGPFLFGCAVLTPRTLALF